MNTPDHRSQPCNIIICGASGDLSRKKLIPALFSVYCNDQLPESFRIIGFARSNLSDQEFRDQMIRHLTCRYERDRSTCEQKMQDFLSRCHYVAGAYDDAESFHRLQRRIEEIGHGDANMLFYMAIPPSIFAATAHSIKKSKAAENRHKDRWTRVVLEKPFGRDSESSLKLGESLDRIFAEKQIYRIDHYLGKEVIQNLLILRFANLIFEPVWNRNYIDSVSIAWSEKIGCEGRAGYFDQFGIIRDVVQNHLLQIVALVGMEQPIRLDAEATRDEKVKLLRCVESIRLENLTVGQYMANRVGGVDEAGYLDDPEVPKDSITPTYASAVLAIKNPRWHGVPFYVKAGKALDTSMTEIQIRFKEVPGSIFAHFGNFLGNRLVIRVQPNEAVELHIVNKIPGLAQELAEANLNLLYKAAFQQVVPEAYERLILEVLRGDRSLFIRADELAAAWDIVTPALHALEKNRIHPQPYLFGSSGPQL